MNILVIENEVLQVGCIIAGLRRAGHHVLSAGNGHEALELLKTHSIELVLLDPVASRTEGYELCRRIQGQSGARIIPLKARGPAHKSGPGIDSALTVRPGLAESLAQGRAAVKHPSLGRRTPFNLNLQTLSSQLARGIARIHPITVAWAYLVALSLAEVLTTVGEPRLGLMLYGFWLILLLCHSAWQWENPIHQLLLSLTVVPLIRLISLSLPLADLPVISWYLIITLPLVVTAAMIGQALQFSWTEMGLNLRQWLVQLMVGLTGLPLGYAGYQILRPTPLITAPTWVYFCAAALILFVYTGFAEELIFRGVMQRAAAVSLGNFAPVYVAVLHTTLHMGHRSPVHILVVLGVGLYFGWIVHKTGSISGVILGHGLFNIILFLAGPFLPLPL
jgi:membrane protease YdiL (CAAX protease family)/CheY-like chemotaxis protein